MNKITVKDIALIGVMVAVIEACKFALSAIPNVELTSFWIIVFTLMFKKKIFVVIPVFILIEGAVFGFGLWWVMYLYAWPLLAIVTFIFHTLSSLFRPLYSTFIVYTYIIKDGKQKTHFPVIRSYL